MGDAEEAFGGSENSEDDRYGAEIVESNWRRICFCMDEFGEAEGDECCWWGVGGLEPALAFIVVSERDEMR